MRAIVLLCLLHAAFADFQNIWPKHASTTPHTGPPPYMPYVCLADQASCGCCLMQKQMERMEAFFNMSYEGMHKELKASKMALKYMRESRSAFSVALDDTEDLRCFGPFDEDTRIVYKHVFINLGDGYSVETGIFTVPCSGVYSLALTIYSNTGSPGNTLAACATVLVNGQVVAGLSEQNQETGQTLEKYADKEDSATFVFTRHLKAGDEVAVNLPKGCVICDDKKHYNTFTGFLLYATDYVTNM